MEEKTTCLGSASAVSSRTQNAGEIKGHIARVCRSKGAPPKTLRKPGNGWEAEAKWVQADSTSADDSLELGRHGVQDQRQ